MNEQIARSAAAMDKLIEWASNWVYNESTITETKKKDLTEAERDALDVIKKMGHGL